MKYFLPSACLLLALGTASIVHGQSKAGYNYTVDISKVVDDRVYVELATPKFTTDETTFFLPKIIPGTYKVADYGRYVNDLKAFDKKGNALAVEKLTDNSWKIKGAKGLTKISYWIDDVVDTEKEGPNVYPMAATNIEEGKNFVLETSGVFGYFENTKNVPFHFDVIKDKDFYGATGLIAQSTDEPITVLKLEKKPENTNKRVDRYQVESYDRLIDSPLMYGKPDTAVIKVANAEVLISCYSPNHVINSKEIAGAIRDILMAQKEYLGGKLPVDKYAFLFYFTDKPVNSYGALEHSYSSFYYMPENPIDALRGQLISIAAHEFFHIVTPLTIHSEEIHHFDFNEPKMSKHLWLYEGVTEYFASNVQVKYGLLNQDQYLDVIHQKMVGASGYKDNVPFTDISKFTLEQYGDQYNNVYQKGALIGMCLDIKLRSLSAGKYGIQNLISDLSKTYGKNAAFQDEVLFDKIEKLTYPEIGAFLKRYVSGPESLPYAEVMELVGVNYTAEKEGSSFSNGFNFNGLTLSAYEDKKRIAFVDLSGLNEQGTALGFKEGDILIKMNGQEMPQAGIFTFMNRQVANFKEGETLKYSVMRKDDAGNFKEVELSAPIAKVKTVERFLLSFNPNATEKQLAVRKAWLTPAK